RNGFSASRFPLPPSRLPHCPECQPRETREQESDGTLGQHGQSNTDARDNEQNPLSTSLKLEQRDDSREDQEIEERVDDPGAEVEIRQQRSAQRQPPPQSKAAVNELPP